MLAEGAGERREQPLAIAKRVLERALSHPVKQIEEHLQRDDRLDCMSAVRTGRERCEHRAGLRIEALAVALGKRERAHRWILDRVGTRSPTPQLTAHDRRHTAPVAA